VQQMRQHQPRRPRAHDPDLSPHLGPPASTISVRYR
jgi:hypothetical protein